MPRGLIYTDDSGVLSTDCKLRMKGLLTICTSGRAPYAQVEESALTESPECSCGHQGQTGPHFKQDFARRFMGPFAEIHEANT